MYVYTNAYLHTLCFYLFTYLLTRYFIVILKQLSIHNNIAILLSMNMKKLSYP